MRQNINFELERAINGDINSKNIIIDYYTNYIRKLIQTKYKDIKIYHNELLNIGLLALLEVFAKANEIKDINDHKIKYFINKDIKNFIKNENKFNNSKITLDTHIDNSLENRDSILDINKAFNSLSQKYQNIIYLHFYENYTLEKIGQIYNVSSSRIGQIIEQALKKMAKILNQCNIDTKTKITNQKNKKTSINTNFVMYRLKKILFNYNSLEIENALKKLEKQDFILLKNNLIRSNNVNNNTCVPFIIEKIKNLIIEEKIQNNNLSFYDFFPNYQKTNIDDAISLLPKDEKILIEFLINNNVLFCNLINGSLKFKINKIIYKITQILQDKTYVISIRKNAIYKRFYNYSEEEIDFVFSLLNNNDKALINLYYSTNIKEINFEVQRIFCEMEETIKIFHLIFTDQKNIYDILDQYNKFDIDNVINELESTDLKIWNTECNSDINLGIKKYYIYTDKITKKLEKCKKLEFK